MGAPIKVFNSLWDQLTNAPSHLLALVGLIALGILIKRSSIPNNLIPWLLVIAGAGGYPFLASPKNIDPSFQHPMVVLCIYGGLLALASVGVHMFVLSKFKWFRKFERALSVRVPEKEPST